MEKLDDELRKILKKYEYIPTFKTNTAKEIVSELLKEFVIPERAVSVLLMSLGNTIKRLAILCDKYEPGYWEEVMGDEIIAWGAKYATQLFKTQNK